MRIKDPSSRWLAGAITVILALIVLSVAVTFLMRPEATLLPEDTPEGIVQRYLQAIDAGDPQTAHSYLSTELQESCTYQYFRDSARWLDNTDLGVALEDTVSIDGQVEVRVRITQYQGSSPFDSGEHSHTQWFTLEREDEAWRLVDPPWPSGYCPGLERVPPAKPAPMPTSTAPSGEES